LSENFSRWFEKIFCSEEIAVGKKLAVWKKLAVGFEFSVRNKFPLLGIVIRGRFTLFLQ
jgi:hypothetical protein